MIRLTLEDILVSNPRINRRVLEESFAMDKVIKGSHIKKKEYDILSPYDRRSILKTNGDTNRATDIKVARIIRIGRV